MRKLSEAPTVHPGAEISASRLGRYTEIQTGSRLLNVDFGDYSYTDRFADIANAVIGKFCNIASFSRINPGDHPMERASLHHFTYRSAMYFDDAEDEQALFDWRAARAATLGPDVWIGHGALVMAGRELGPGAVLAAGAVLTKSAGPYEIWAGVPARKIRDRHPPAVADRLIRLAWWDWPHARLRAALEDFRALSAEAFLEKHEGA